MAIRRYKNSPDSPNDWMLDTMTMPDLEVVRSQVDELLKDCVDQKLLSGGTIDAVAFAQQAFDLATSSNLHSPWPEFAAYRLAHLKMRAEKVGVDALREIDSLFERASRSEKTGPLPLIYRLAVLQRLAQELGKNSEIALAAAKFDEVHAKALALLRSERLAPRERSHDRVELQSAAYNMLEFATYVSGRSHKPLEGLSPIDPFRSGSWFVLGTGIGRINMTENMARWEFEQRANASPEIVLIEITKGNSKLCLSKNREWHEWNLDYGKLVTLFLLKLGISTVDLVRKVIGTEAKDPSASFRQAKTRTQKELAKLTGIPALKVFDGDQLTNEVQILVLVGDSSLR